MIGTKKLSGNGGGIGIHPDRGIVRVMLLPREWVHRKFAELAGFIRYWFQLTDKELRPPPHRREGFRQDEHAKPRQASAPNALCLSSSGAFRA